MPQAWAIGICSAFLALLLLNAVTLGIAKFMSINGRDEEDDLPRTQGPERRAMQRCAQFPPHDVTQHVQLLPVPNDQGPGASFRSLHSHGASLPGQHGGAM